MKNAGLRAVNGPRKRRAILRKKESAAAKLLRLAFYHFGHEQFRNLSVRIFCEAV